jgi:hypothetical protein
LPLSGCKVTHFLSLTQTFLGKSDIVLHIWGVIVQKIDLFVCVTSDKNAKFDENIRNLLVN